MTPPATKKKKQKPKGTKVVKTTMHKASDPHTQEVTQGRTGLMWRLKEKLDVCEQFDGARKLLEQLLKSDPAQSLPSFFKDLLESKEPTVTINQSSHFLALALIVTSLEGRGLGAVGSADTVRLMVDIIQSQVTKDKAMLPGCLLLYLLMLQGSGGHPDTQTGTHMHADPDHVAAFIKHRGHQVVWDKVKMTSDLKEDPLCVWALLPLSVAATVQAGSIWLKTIGGELLEFKEELVKHKVNSTKSSLYTNFPGLCSHIHRGINKLLDVLEEHIIKQHKIMEHAEFLNYETKEKKKKKKKSKKHTKIYNDEPEVEQVTDESNVKEKLSPRTESRYSKTFDIHDQLNSQYNLKCPATQNDQNTAQPANTLPSSVVKPPGKTQQTPISGPTTNPAPTTAPSTQTTFDIDALWKMSVACSKRVSRKEYPPISKTSPDDNQVKDGSEGWTRVEGRKQPLRGDGDWRPATSSSDSGPAHVLSYAGAIRHGTSDIPKAAPMRWADVAKFGCLRESVDTRTYAVLLGDGKSHMSGLQDGHSAAPCLSTNNSLALPSQGGASCLTTHVVTQCLPSHSVTPGLTTHSTTHCLTPHSVTPRVQQTSMTPCRLPSRSVIPCLPSHTVTPCITNHTVPSDLGRCVLSSVKTPVKMPVTYKPSDIFVGADGTLVGVKSDDSEHETIDWFKVAKSVAQSSGDGDDSIDSDSDSSFESSSSCDDDLSKDLPPPTASPSAKEIRFEATGENVSALANEKAYANKTRSNIKSYCEACGTTSSSADCSSPERKESLSDVTQAKSDVSCGAKQEMTEDQHEYSSNTGHVLSCKAKPFTSNNIFINREHDPNTCYSLRGFSDSSINLSSEVDPVNNPNPDESSLSNCYLTRMFDINPSCEDNDTPNKEHRPTPHLLYSDTDNTKRPPNLNNVSSQAFWSHGKEIPPKLTFCNINGTLWNGNECVNSNQTAIRAQEGWPVSMSYMPSLSGMSSLLDENIVSTPTYNQQSSVATSSYFVSVTTSNEVTRDLPVSNVSSITRPSAPPGFENEPPCLSNIDWTHNMFNQNGTPQSTSTTSNINILGLDSKQSSDFSKRSVDNGPSNDSMFADKTKSALFNPNKNSTQTIGVVEPFSQSVNPTMACSSNVFSLPVVNTNSSFVINEDILSAASSVPSWADRVRPSTQMTFSSLSTPQLAFSPNLSSLRINDSQLQRQQLEQQQQQHHHQQQQQQQLSILLAQQNMHLRQQQHHHLQQQQLQKQHIQQQHQARTQTSSIFIRNAEPFVKKVTPVFHQTQQLHQQRHSNIQSTHSRLAPSSAIWVQHHPQQQQHAQAQNQQQQQQQHQQPSLQSLRSHRLNGSRIGRQSRAVSPPVLFPSDLRGDPPAAFPERGCFSLFNEPRRNEIIIDLFSDPMFMERLAIEQIHLQFVNSRLKDAARDSTLHSLRDSVFANDLDYYASLYKVKINDVLSPDRHLPSLHTDRIGELGLSRRFHDDSSASPSSPDCDRHIISRRWREDIKRILSLPWTQREQHGNIILPAVRTDIRLGRGEAPLVLGLTACGRGAAVLVLDKRRAYIDPCVLEVFADPSLEQHCVLQCKGMSETLGVQYVALELCDYTLDEYIDSMGVAGHRPPPGATSLCWQLLEALRFMHGSLAMAHGCLRPSWIFVDAEGRLRLGGYGIMTRPDAGEGRSGCWKSTEDLTCDLSEPTLTGDIQVAGMLLHYILTGGRHPFGSGFGSSNAELEANIARGSAQLQHVTDEADDLVAAMLARDPPTRPHVEHCLKHPLFWSHKEKFKLILLVGSDVLTEMKTGIALTGTGALTMMEILTAVDVCDVSHNWVSEILGCVMQEMRCFRMYRNTLAELTLFIYNCCLHFDKMSLGAKDMLGDPCKYFLGQFPSLFMAIYRSLAASDRTDRACYKPFF